MPYIRLFLVCLVALAALLFATGFERIYWMFSGSGLVAVIPKSIYSTVPDISCSKRSIEVKRDSDGVFRYRCGDYWANSTEARSPALTSEWKRVAALIADTRSIHP